MITNATYKVLIMCVVEVVERSITSSTSTFSTTLTTLVYVFCGASGSALAVSISGYVLHARSLIL